MSALLHESELILSDDLIELIVDKVPLSHLTYLVSSVLLVFSLEVNKLLGVSSDI